MSPDSYVRAIALVTALAILACSALAPPIWGLAIAATVGMCCTSLNHKYKRDVAHTSQSIPHHRERLDLVVNGDARAAVAVGLTGSGIMLAGSVGGPVEGVSQWSAILLAIVCSSIYLSSLVDWFIILPRVSGQLGVRPCRNDHAGFPSFPRTWRDLTRWWYIHRIAASFAVRFGVPAIAGLTLRLHLDSWLSSVITAVMFVGLSFHERSATRALFGEAAHPTFIVGDTVQRRPPGDRLPWFSLRLPWRTVTIPRCRRRPSGPARQREYVFDVSVEGVQLSACAARERAIPRKPDGSVDYERRPGKMPLKNLAIAEADCVPFTGCADECSGINWYCIDNPDCYRGK